ncbi:YkgJ family cysteine cluster protein [bacterium]|nr:YkgJ family cysteine cluster protein [bacterium]
MNSQKEKNHSATVSETTIDACSDCGARCCHDITMLITKPRTKTEINELTQYLHYDTASVFIRSRKWYLTFKGRCIYLSDKDRCTKYPKRPPRCRKHAPPGCEKFDIWYDVLFETPEDFEGYLENPANGGKRRPHM